jgi:hypothetical protein
MAGVVYEVFSATKCKDREALGERVTEWLREHNVEVLDHWVLQSSDREYHCLSIIVCCKERA